MGKSPATSLMPRVRMRSIAERSRAEHGRSSRTVCACAGFFTVLVRTLRTRIRLNRRQPGCFIRPQCMTYLRVTTLEY
ncbi:hypothetical protein GY45DRAFT_1123705 [Cubamyces sp. BRFM 1775]|nr:hypothetical protein GY45DRAFT_1123705 [Cubamyces sp. BRFM 1775]